MTRWICKTCGKELLRYADFKVCQYCGRTLNRKRQVVSEGMLPNLTLEKMKKLAGLAA
jgi:transposase-like protein